jgi:membrane AbrB-like protein
MTEAPARNLLPVAAALLLSLAGGVIAHLIGLPAPYIVGGSAAVAAAALLGVKLALPATIRDAGFVIVGLSMGASVSRDALALIGQWPVTIAALAISLTLIVGLTGWALSKFHGFDLRTALLASTPGHASFIQGLALSGLGDARQIAVVQSVRILTLVIVVPLFIAATSPGPLMPISGGAPIDVLTLVWLTMACAAFGFLAQRVGVPAGYVIGAMIASTAARLTGLTEGTAPDWLVIPGFVIIAALIGARFSGVTGDLLRRSLGAGLIATVLALVISAGAAWAASLFVDISYAEIWIAIAPGGFESMAGMGLALGYDPAFVVTHHTVRLFILSAAMPLLMAALRGVRRPASGAASRRNAP